MPFGPRWEFLASCSGVWLVGRPREHAAQRAINLDICRAGRTSCGALLLARSLGARVRGRGKGGCCSDALAVCCFAAPSQAGCGAACSGFGFGWRWLAIVGGLYSGERHVAATQHNDGTAVAVAVAVAAVAVLELGREVRRVYALLPQLLPVALVLAVTQGGATSFTRDVRQLLSARWGVQEQRASIAEQLRTAEPPLRGRWVGGKVRAVAARSCCWARGSCWCWAENTHRENVRGTFTPLVRRCSFRGGRVPFQTLWH